MKPIYSKLVCEYCGRKNQLYFEPKKKSEFWKIYKVVCGYCGWLCYWENYFSADVLVKMLISPYKKKYLKEFYSPVVLHSKGHKKPHSKSI